MNASMDQQYLLAYKDFLDNDGIEDQLTFHKNARKRSDDIAHFLSHHREFVVRCNFSCLRHTPDFPRLGMADPPSSSLSGFGAAMAGIAFQAEFKRVGRRSKAMIDALGEASKSLKMKPINYETIAETAIQATDIMIAEVLDWRVLFLERKPQLPA